MSHWTASNSLLSSPLHLAPNVACCYNWFHWLNCQSCRRYDVTFVSTLMHNNCYNKHTVSKWCLTESKRRERLQVIGLFPPISDICNVLLNKRALLFSKMEDPTLFLSLHNSALYSWSDHYLPLQNNNRSIHNTKYLVSLGLELLYVYFAFMIIVVVAKTSFKI